MGKHPATSDKAKASQTSAANNTNCSQPSLTMANTNPSLESLAATISETANALSSKLKDSGLPPPSFAEDGLVEYPNVPELIGLRFQLIDAAADLYRLALGPTDNSIFAPLHVSLTTLRTMISD